MADNDEYDEYQFSDLDTIDTDSLSDDDSALETDSSSKREPQKKNVLRNALIVIVLIFFTMLGYKFFSSFGKNKSAGIPVGVTPLAPVAQEPVVVPAQPKEQAIVPIQPSVPEQPAVDNSQINQKLSALEMGQQNVRSEVSSVNSQLGGINANVSQLTEKIASLNQTIAALAAKVEQQSGEMATLTERARPKPVKQIVIKQRTLVKIPVYYIQAVIPGRAWLIASNGSTISVREGTRIAGYGVVTLIDPNQGRVVTSSGQVIRFSQQDS